MMKKLLALAAIVPLQALASNTVSWTTWVDTGHGSFEQNSVTVNVTYTGDVLAVDTWENMYDVPASFTNAVVTNTPTMSQGTLQMSGGSAVLNTFHFDKTVIDPVIVLFSVGQGGSPVRFVFDDSYTFTIGAQGGGHWGGGTLTQVGNTVTGYEGNGLLQFTGSYSGISFYTPDSEFYYGATVGAMATAVPEPESYALLLGGLTAIGCLRRCRRRT